MKNQWSLTAFEFGNELYRKMFQTFNQALNYAHDSLFLQGFCEKSDGQWEHRTTDRLYILKKEK